MTSVSSNTNTPRNRGSLRSLPEKNEGTRLRLVSSWPSGNRNAVAIWRGPRIITPSIRAWPP